MLLELTNEFLQRVLRISQICLNFLCVAVGFGRNRLQVTYVFYEFKYCLN